jgi:serine/threonine-protein kinase
MEYVPGTDLKTAITTQGPLEQHKVAEIGSQVCSALSVAHGYDIIHRDIKPHNIMIQPDGNAKVMDFGIAHAGNSNMTQTDSVLGTAYYVSPEQAQGKTLTPSTDLYSLGIVLYESVTGQLPFEGPDPVSIAVKQVNEQPKPPHEIKPDIDPDLEAIIMKAMQKDPAARFLTANEMRMALNNYLAGRPSDVNMAADPGARTQVIGGAIPVSAPGTANAAEGTAVMPVVSNTRPTNISTRDANNNRKRGGNRGGPSGGSGSNTKRNGIIIGVIIAVIVVALATFFIVSSCTSGPGVQVPNVVGQTQENAEDTLEGAGFTIGAETQQVSDTVAAGNVISQDPKGNTKAPAGSSVNLVISSGKTQVTVPDLTGMSPSDAKAALDKVGLVYAQGSDKASDTVAKGMVCAQNPAGNQQAAKGSTVTVNLSSGTDKVSVPDTTGMSQASATSTLQNAGFTVATADGGYSDNVQQGYVMSQTPSGGSTAAKGSTVTITISKGSQPASQVTVPNLMGMSLSAAVSTLSGKGLTIWYSGSGTGTVVAQNPPAGSTVDSGSTVSVTFG